MVFHAKTIFFLGKSHLFPGKKLVFLFKPIFFLGKTPKKHFLGLWPHSLPKDFCFGFFGFQEKVCFPSQNHLFPRKKLFFSAQNHLFPRKKLVFLPKTIFFLGKTKKTIFLKSGRLVSQKMFFFVLWFSLGKSWFSFPQPFFS